ncbi:hypothetical protein [Streptomyces daliensis]|uniref:Uncharacterized protein n=1 Tax=Streptomyces daliensis TaxID=299421 RepID=A0A8T4IXT7_9ACTN|nr:hypothetical protein [Streptomyces daliensis]
MTGHSHRPSQGPQPFRPQLGDLARDSARNGHIGVVVAEPDGKTAASFHLRPPGGGAEWSAHASGITLSPVLSPPTHITPLGQPATYDARAQQGALPVFIHYEDGGKVESVLVCTPDEFALVHAEMARLMEGRETGEAS